MSLVNHRIRSAELVQLKMIRVVMDGYDHYHEKDWYIQNETNTLKLSVSKMDDTVLELQIPHCFEFDKDNYLLFEGESCFIEITEVVRTEEFDELFYYKRDDLGVTYRKECTKLAVWSPVATKVNVIVYQNWYDEKGIRLACTRDQKGVWRKNMKGDYEGSWYVFEVFVNKQWLMAVDPYAKFLSVNGKKAMIGDLSKTNHIYWPKLKPLISPNDMIIYEVHIRDFTVGRTNGIHHKGQYLGMTETKTEDKRKLVTGLDYLERLGITHVELLPVQEFGSIDESDRHNPNHYNWGYDTTHFFVPEGSYATDPYDGYARIIELKKAIAAFHKKQLRVILDVVFNHVYIWEDSPLEKLVPGYFFRRTDENDMSNGTGVGNDFASERKMARKIIIDSIRYWLQEFQVDGFRFDLMGILDIDTMKQVEVETNKVNKQIVVLGEGWDLPTAYPNEKRAITDQARELKGISFFQDKFRDGIKGSTFDSTQPGFISGNGFSIDEMVSGVKASIELFSRPSQAINYVEAHDNHTLWDKLKNVHPYEDEITLQKRHRLATSIVLLSQGIPFLHAGQEWFRTKHGIENSYNSPDWINHFDWNQRAYFEKTVNYIRGLIKIRRAHPAFRLESYQLIKKHFHLLLVESDCIAYHLMNVGDFDQWDDVIVMHNGSNEWKKLSLPSNTQWYIVVDDQAASLIPLSKIGEDCVFVSPLSTFVCINYQTK